MNNATTFFLGNTILGSDGFYSSDYKYVEINLNENKLYILLFKLYLNK